MGIRGPTFTRSHFSQATESLDSKISNSMMLMSGRLFLGVKFRSQSSPCPCPLWFGTVSLDYNPRCTKICLQTTTQELSGTPAVSLTLGAAPSRGKHCYGVQTWEVPTSHTGVMAGVSAVLSIPASCNEHPGRQQVMA